MKTYRTIISTIFSERHCNLAWIPHWSTIVTFVTLKSSMTIFNHWKTEHYSKRKDRINFTYLLRWAHREEILLLETWCVCNRFDSFLGYLKFMQKKIVCIIYLLFSIKYLLLINIHRLLTSVFIQSFYLSHS